MSANDKVRATHHDPSGTLPDRLRAAAPYLGVVDALLMEEAAAVLDERPPVRDGGVVLLPPPLSERRHVCLDVLPEVDLGMNPQWPVYRDEGTLAICSCGRAWVVRKSFRDMRPFAWRPVRWWHRRLRERIEQTLPPRPAPPGSSYADPYQGETVPVTTRELLDADDE